MNKKSYQYNQPLSNTFSHAAEYKIIKHDLFKVLGLNILYLGAVLFVYYTNLESHFLDKIFSQYFKF